MEEYLQEESPVGEAMTRIDQATRASGMLDDERLG